MQEIEISVEIYVIFMTAIDLLNIFLHMANSGHIVLTDSELQECPLLAEAVLLWFEVFQELKEESQHSPILPHSSYYFTPGIGAMCQCYTFAESN